MTVLPRNYYDFWPEVKVTNKLRKVVRKIFEKIGFLIISLGRITYLSEQEKRVAPWFTDNGDKTLRLNYDLYENSVVDRKSVV